MDNIVRFPRESGQSDFADGCIKPYLMEVGADHIGSAYPQIMFTKERHQGYLILQAMLQPPPERQEALQSYLMGLTTDLS